MYKNLVTIIVLVCCSILAETSYATSGQDLNQLNIEQVDLNSVEIKCHTGVLGCEQIINAKGIFEPATKNFCAIDDKVNYDTKAAERSITNLGRISQIKEISLPVPDAGQKLYAITPTKGLYANKTLKILFVAVNLNEKPAAGVPERFMTEAKKKKTEDAKRNTAIKVYVKRSGEVQWTEIISYYTPETKNLGSVKVKVNPDGTFIVPGFFGAEIKGNLANVCQ